jgi:SecD/SecF fusion protein
LKKHIGKILIIVIPVLVALFLLYPTYKASDLMDIQAEYLERAENAETSKDSLDIMEEFDEKYGKDLEAARQDRLKLGLDLRGGMYVTLEVDVIKLLQESAQQDAIDDIFMEVIEATKKDAEGTEEDIIDIFQEKFNEIAAPKRRYLSDYFDFGNIDDLTEADKRIIEILKENEDDAIDQALTVMRERVDKYGVSEPTIQKQGARRILLELPGVTDETQMRQLIQTTARLEFKLVRNNQDLVSAFYKIDAMLAKDTKISDTKQNEPIPVDTTAAIENDTLKSADEQAEITDAATTEEAEGDTTEVKTEEAQPDTTDPYAGLSEEDARDKYLKDHPFTTLFSTYYITEGPNARRQPVNYAIDAFPAGEYGFEISNETLDRFMEIISRPEVQELLPEGIEVVIDKGRKFPTQSGEEINVYSIYGLKRQAELTGEVITNAQATYDPTDNQPIVIMMMNSEGSESWARITGANIKKRIAIVLDNIVRSAPVVQNKIVGGTSQITGMENAEEARMLKIVLKAGALRAPVQIIEERVVGPSLGQDSIDAGITSMVVAFLLVILYMLFYYNRAGAIADFAVLLNVFLIVSILAAFQGTLTLPGIAGIILTIGMAVDANILIFERIREELYKGRSLRSAVDEGFSKALSAILDSNITTFITGLILYFLGSGPIQGFALTIMIGIMANLFTGIVVSRAIIELLISKGATDFSFGQPKVKTAN